MSLLRIDPTRTTLLRRKFMLVLRERFRRIKRNVLALVVDEDVFGLRSNRLAVNDRWRFLTDSQKLREFEEWLRGQFGRELLGADEQELWRAYVEEGYRRGAGRAFDDTRRAQRFAPGAGEFYQGSKTEFLRSAFAQPVAIERVKVLASRVLTDLKGVTDATATTMLRTLTDGFVQGQSPRDIARNLVNRLDGIGLKRALDIARTEIIRSHSEGTLDGLEMLGVEEVGVSVEWSAVADACPLCAPLDGLVLKISEARGMIPRHVSCRCAWVPANVGESKRGQKRSRQSILKGIGESVKEETGASTVRDAKEASRWTGADVEPSKDRPKSVLNLESLYRDLKTLLGGNQW